MDQVTQQNAAMVEQSTAASHSLATDAIELARLIGQFNIGAAATPAAVRKPVVPPASKPLRAKASASRGGAARKYEPAFETDSWEEF